MSLKIYFAGPDVFRADDVEALELQKQAAKAAGVVGVVPFDPGPDIRQQLAEDELGTPKHAMRIYQENYRLIDGADVIIANLVPFRGASPDDGTAWELGYGAARGKRLYGYTQHAGQNYPDVIRTHFPEAYARQQTDFPELEAFGWTVNLMLQGSIEESGGAVLGSLEACLAHLKSNPPQ